LNLAAGEYLAATQLKKTKTTLVAVRTQKVKEWIIMTGSGEEEH
jgi:hypothetical protein